MRKEFVVSSIDGFLMACGFKGNNSSILWKVDYKCFCSLWLILFIEKVEFSCAPRRDPIK